MTLTIDALRGLLERATPPPWRWYGNTQSKHLQIATVGHGICAVMGFERWGMSGAAPRFAVCRDWANDRWGGRLVRADEMARYEVLSGRTIAEARREPYRFDVVGIDHPDATLLVEAVNALPSLLAAAAAGDALRMAVGEAILVTTADEVRMPRADWDLIVEAAIAQRRTTDPTAVDDGERYPREETD